MTLGKRILSAVLCLCLVYTMIPVTAEAAKADPNAKPAVSYLKTLRYSSAKETSDFTSVKYSPGYKQGRASAECVTTALEDGRDGTNLTVTTESNQFAEFGLIPFTTSLVVPAKTTCTVEQKFILNYAKQIVANTKATAAASFELLYFGETPIEEVTNKNVIPATQDTTSSAGYGAKEGTPLLRGYRTGKSTKADDGKTRYIDTDAVKSYTSDFVYKNDTNTEQTITYNFALWACTQWASKYENQFDISFDVELGAMTAEEQVTFDPNGGSVSTASKTVNFGETYGTLPTLSRANYTFDGWYTAKTGGTRVTSSTKVTTFGGHTLYAHWTGKKSTVTFNANGGKVSPTSKSVNYQSPYGTLPTPTRENYDFAGWHTASSGGTKVTETTTVTKTVNHTLYAHWTLKQFTVTFSDPVNNETITPATKTVTYGETYGELPSPTHEGDCFAGWYTEKYGRGTEITSDSIVELTGDQTLYALWIVQPDIREWSKGQTVEYGNRSTTLFGMPLSKEHYDYLFQWYQCDADGKNAKLVGESRYTSTIDEPWYRTPSDLPVGTYYFYATITQTDLEYNKSASITGPVTKVTVVPSTPVVAEWPKNVVVNLNSGSTRLGDYDILDGAMKNAHSSVAVPGTFSWLEPDTEIKSTTSYMSETQRMQVLFTPDDTTNYKSTTFGFNVTVQHSHKYVDSEVLTAATCTETGQMKQECSICGATKNVTTPTLGHDYKNGTWEYDDSQHWKQCSRCDSTDTPADHVFSGLCCNTCGYEKPQTITVTITWNELAFTYTDGIWDPETHEYTQGQWSVDVQDGGMITVENQGNTDITVELVYDKAIGNSTVEGSFVDDVHAAIESPLVVAVGDKKYAWLLLSGKPERDMQGDTVGTVTVRLGGNT